VVDIVDMCVAGELVAHVLKFANTQVSRLIALPIHQWFFAYSFIFEFGSF
jgi:hypothetical protein